MTSKSTTARKRLTKSRTRPAGADYTHAEAEALATRLVTAQIERETLVADRDAAMLKAAGPFAPDIDRLDSELKTGLAILEAWAEHHIEEFAKAESVLLSGHRVGWRLGNHAAKPLPKWTWKKVLEAILEAPQGLRDRYLRVKTEPNREALVADRDLKDQLKSVGVRVVQERRFYLEPAREGQEETTLTTPKP